MNNIRTQIKEMNSYIYMPDLTWNEIKVFRVKKEAICFNSLACYELGLYVGLHVNLDQRATSVSIFPPPPAIAFANVESS